MNTREQVRQWWKPYQCAPGRMVTVPFPGQGRTWELLVAAPAKDVWTQFAEIMDAYSYEFREGKGGTYNCRPPSLHANGLALDLNPDTMPPGSTKHDYPDGFVESVLSIRSKSTLEKVFRWGIMFNLPDPMHWEVNVAPAALKNGTTGGDMPLNDADKAFIRDAIRDEVAYVLGGGREEMNKVDPAEPDRYGNRGIINSVWRTTIDPPGTATQEKTLDALRRIRHDTETT